MPRRRRKTVSVTALILCFCISLSALIAAPDSQAASPDEQAIQFAGINVPEKGHPKLQSALQQLMVAEQNGRLSTHPWWSGIDVVDGMVRVVIEATSGQAEAAAGAAEGLGGAVEIIYADWVQAMFPISMLTALADSPSIDFVRLPRTPWPAVESEGLGIINVPAWSGAGFTGAGVKVGILDTGFLGYEALLGTELPGTVNSHWAPSIGGPGDLEHGTACAEIVYDIAPDAQFYLANLITEVEFADAVDWMIGNDVDVISCSLNYPLWGPGDGTGLICDKVAYARNAGVLWSNSAGNYAQSHWTGDWEDSNANFLHDFGPADELNTFLTIADTYILVCLTWDDPWGASGNDYDLLLVDASGTVVAWSNNRQLGTQDPVEGLLYQATYTGFYHIAIIRWWAAGTANFHLFAKDHQPEYQVSSGSLVPPADSSSAMTVGAVRWYSPDVLELFSSQGPTTDDRTKPDLVAPDGVTTQSYGVSGFLGSSASTPHAAGAATLVKQRFPTYTPAQIQAYLEEHAIDLGDAGKDNLYGSGRLYLPPLNTPPEVTNVVGSQGAGTGTVNISYDLDDAEQSSVDVNLQYWVSGGSWHECTATTGEGSTSTGTGKTGTWDAKIDFDGQYRAYCLIRVTADDGQPVDNIGQGDSAPFTLDTKAPAGYGCDSPDDEAIDVPVDTTLTTTPGTDDSPPIFYKFMLAEDSGFSQVVQESDWQSGLSWPPSTLADATDYWWKVKAKDSFENEGNWCTPRKFTTEVAPPTVITDEATDITTSSATLNGSVDSLGDYGSVDVSFEWGTSPGVYTDETTPKETTSAGPSSEGIDGLASNTTHYFRIKATGSITVYGDETSFTTLASYDIALGVGWNLVSLPLVPTSGSIEDILAGIIGNVDSVWAYDGNARGWSFYAPGEPSDLTEMTCDRGYWIRVNDACTLTVVGIDPTLPCGIPLASGWNLIGLPLISGPQSIDDILADIIDNVDSVWAYDSNARGWSFYAPGEPSDLTEMTRDRGYWVRVHDSCTLTVQD